MWRIILLSLCASIFFISCDEDDPKPADPTPTISVVDVPAFVQCEFDSFYLYRVRIENLDDVEFVQCTITRPNGTGGLAIDLYDDGNTSNHVGPAFASPTSLDAVPHNGTFTRGIRGDLFCQEGEGIYRFHFVTMGGSQTLEIPNLDVEVRSIDDCIFGNVNPIVALPGCFSAQNISITVTPETGFVIDSVRAMWISGDTLWWSELLSHGTGHSWSYTLSPSLFGCTPSGSNYTWRYEAFTQFGLNCALNVVQGISFTNLLPVLSDPQLADTLYRPLNANDTDTLEFFIRSDDCELLGWPVTQAAIFEVSRDDTMHWNQSPDFFLRDDGVAPDVESGDGLASSFILVPHSDTNLNNMYYFRYYSVDCASDESTDYLIDSTRIIQTVDENGPFATIPYSGDMGLSSFK